MCVAIHKPLGCTISRKDLNDAWETNPHGGGFAYRTSRESEIVVMKGYMSKKKWVRAIMLIQGDVEMLIHARIATHGLKDHTNTHPFELPGGGAWIHNGVVPGYPMNVDHSDTAMFTNEFLIPLLTDYPDFMQHEYGCKMVAELLSVSKGMFMLPGLDVILLNTKHCTVEEGVCFSNTSFRTTKSWANSYNTKDWVWNAKTHSYTYTPPAQQAASVLPLGGKCIEYDDDPEWLRRWGDETLMDEGESTGDDEGIPPLTPAQKLAFQQLDEADKVQLEEDRSTHAVVPWKPQAEPPFNPTIWVNGQQMSYVEYQKLQVKVHVKKEVQQP